MDDRQPLLNASSKFPIDDDDDDDDDDDGNKKQLLINSFFDWCRRFSKKGKDNKYIKLDDDTEHNDKDEPVGVFRLFRFANRMDFVLMFIAACLAVVDTICALVIPVLFGRLTGIFVTEAFSDNCDYQHQNSITSMKNNNTYLQAIELNIFNNDSSYKLRHTMGVILSSTSATSVPLFREKIMNMVYWLFIISAVEFLAGLLEGFIWNISVKRQTFRMRVSLLRSILQRLTAKEAMNELMTYSKAGQIVQEVFSSLRTVLSLNGSKYDRELYPTRWSSIRKGAVFGIYTGWLSLITYLVYSVGFIVGSLLMSHKDDHTLNISDILAVVTIFARCLTYFSFIGPFFQSFSEARGAAASVFRLIDEGNDASVNEIDIWKEDTEAIYNINGDIEFDNINFSYLSRKDVPVLRNLSLIARAGQTTALIGSSGSGKSTCISLFLRYYEPSSGRIMIDGRPITDYNVKQLRQNIGVVSQEPILFGASIYENIRFGKVNATQAEIEQAAREANAHNFIMQLPDKYETLVGERGIQLSGGEKQRIALARALVKQPTFLLLDEATSALDNVNEKIVQEALDRACKGRTTIVIAHRLTTIQNAHHIYVLDNGSVIEQGKHETLMAKEGGKYQSMVKCQQMERINDDQDDMMSIQKATEEDEKSICMLRNLMYTAFATAGSKLTQRIRSKAFACLLRQEVAYFDRPKNSSGAICARLSSDASAVQEMTGTRLGVICEAVALSFFGILFGCFISWQLTLIVFAPLFFLFLIVYGEVSVRSWMTQQSGLINGRASMLIDGIDIRQLNLHWVRSQFGLVSQEPILFDLTIAENIAYGLENVPMEDIINAARKANIHQFIEKLPQHYETKVGLKGSFLSGGEKQRIAIARVLLRQPKVLLLDEATSAMDSHNEQIVQEALEHAQTEDSSRTSLIIAHRLSTICSCDLISVLDRGHIVESGTHTELIQQCGAYYRMLTQNNLQ
ncbi:unnamed protein product [Rotaria sp. Silwood1]|nr:unnamed protein product [Rotaria sp. Silwood1]